MSGGKFAKQQKRRRWCDQGLQVPATYKSLLEDIINAASSEPRSQPGPAPAALAGQPDHHLAEQLLQFINIQFTYGELEELKTTVAAADKLAAHVDGASETWMASMQLLLELLFLQNSRPLHRQILAWVKKLPAAHQQIVGQIVTNRVQQEAHLVLNQAQQTQQQLATLTPTAASQGLNLAQSAVSLLWLPASRPWMQPCSASLLLAVSLSIHSTLSVLQQGGHLTPNTMELVQDAISVMYYTLQHHGQHLATTAGQQGQAAITAAARCMLNALQGTALVREAMASAAVVTWSAAVLPDVPPAAAAAVCALGLTPQQLQQATRCSGSSSGARLSLLLQTFSSSSILEQLLQQQGSSLVQELQQLAPIGRVCALKGLLTAMPAAALAADLVDNAPQPQQQQQQQGTAMQTISSSGITFLMQCVLPFAVAASESPLDSHHKFHAASVVAIALQRAKQVWQELAQQQGLAAAAAAAADEKQSSAVDASLLAAPNSSSIDEAAAADAAALVAPWLTGDGLLTVMELLWSNLDEPMAQTLAKVQDAFEALLELLMYQDTAAAQLGLLLPASTTSTSTSSSRIGSFTDTASFLRATAAAVLAVPPTKKGRYSPLTSLLPRVGATYLLQQQQGLVRQVLAAMQDDMIANSASAFFKALLLQLRKETKEAAAAAGGNALQQQQQQLLALIPTADLRCWCQWWLPDLLDVLWGSNERFRTYVTNHALPVVLGAEPLLLRPMVDMILAAAAAAACGSSSSTGTSDALRPVANATAALVVVLKAARRLQLVGNLDSLLTAQEQQQLQQQYLTYGHNNNSSSSSSTCGPAAVAANGHCAASTDSSNAMLFSRASLLLSAVSSSSAALRLEALELACVNARSTEPPGVLELCIARRWLLLCVRCTGAGSRSKSLVLCDKLITRQRAAVYAMMHRAAVAKKPGATGGAHPGSLPKPSVNYLAPAAATAAAVSDVDVLLRQYDFIRWMSQTLMDSLYPGGPYERKYFALEVLALLLQQWKTDSSSNTDYSAAAATFADSSSSSSLLRVPIVPLSPDVLSASAVQVLLGCLVDTWDKLRMAAARVLKLLPSPLPGVESPDQLVGLLQWAGQLTMSPRVRESDAGARLLTLLFNKYVMTLKWRLQLYPEPAAIPPRDSSSSSSSSGHGSVIFKGSAAAKTQDSNRGDDEVLVTSVLCYLESLTGQLRSQLLLAATDLAAASRRGLVHGVVLTIRYLVDEIPWSKLTNSKVTVSMRVGAAAAAGTCKQAAAVEAGTTTAACGSSSDATSAAADVVVVAGDVSSVVRVWLCDLLSLLLAVSALVQPHLSAQDVNVAADEVEGDEVDDCDGEVDDGDVDDEALDDEQLEQNMADDDDHSTAATTQQQQQQPGSLVLSGPAIQLLTTACWTSVKEVFLLFGTLAKRLPIADNNSSGDGSDQTTTAATATTAAAAAAAAAGSSFSSSSSSSHLLHVDQLSAMGATQLSLLLSMKHNGAVEKSQAGFLWLCEQLLQSSSSSLNSLPGVWLNRCLQRVREPGQCRDDIVRRSAGLPFAISCLFLSEPPGVPRQLLPLGLSQLLDVAEDESAQEPWPRVHAFNVLRCVFNDSAMALDSSGFHAAGVAAAIRGMAAQAWEVRNAAALTFTALVMRVIGYKNAGSKASQPKPLQQLAVLPADLNAQLSDDTAAAIAAVRGSAAAGNSSLAASSSNEGRCSWCQKSPTATEFFYRYPQLHSFLLQQLQSAVDQQQQQQRSGSSSSSSSTGSEVPPSLFPVLVILSRLKPALMMNNLRSVSSSGGSSSSNASSTAAADAGGALSLNALIPAVVAVGQSSVMGVRQIAALSLPPLVAADQLHHICQQLAALLPQQQQQQQCLNHNVLHGTLLQLNAMLSAVASSSSSSSDISSSSSATHVVSLVRLLLPAFLNSSWVAGSSRCSSAVWRAFISAAGQLIMLAYRHWQLLLLTTDAAAASSSVVLLQQLVSSLDSSCQAAMQHTLPTSPPAAAAAARCEASDPQHCCWLRDATAMLLGPLMRVQVLLDHHHQQQQQHPNSSGSSTVLDVFNLVQQILLQLTDKLLFCVGSRSYEVRASALKAAAVQLEHVLQLEQQHPGLLLAAVVANAPAAAAALDRLGAALWGLLEGEPTVKGLKRLLLVLGLLQKVQGAMHQQQQQQQQGLVTAAAAADGSAALQHLRAALMTAKQYKQVEVRIAALTCAAHNIRPLVAAVMRQQASPRDSSSDSSNAKQYIQCMQQLLQLLQSFSLYHQPEEVREAAAHALQVSGLLWPLATSDNACSTDNASNTDNASSSSNACYAVARLSVSAWGCALRLMEDEEDMVRQPAADAAQQVIQAVQAAGLQPAVQVHCQTSCTNAGLLTENTGQYVEAVEQNAFAVVLASCTAWWPDVLPDVLLLLSGVIFDSNAAVPEVLLQQRRRHDKTAAADNASAAAATPAVLAGVLLRRLFEKEADNHHEEPLLLAQHAAAAVRQTLLSTAKQQLQGQSTTAAAAASRFVSSWCSGLVQFLDRVVDSLSAVNSSTAGGWIGGDTNHPEVFIPLYRCLLGLWATAPHWAPDVQQDMQALHIGSSQLASATVSLRSDVSRLASGLLSLQPSALLLPLVEELLAVSGSSVYSSGLSAVVGPAQHAEVVRGRALFLLAE